MDIPDLDCCALSGPHSTHRKRRQMRPSDHVGKADSARRCCNRRHRKDLGRLAALHWGTFFAAVVCCPEQLTAAAAFLCQAWQACCPFAEVALDFPFPWDRSTAWSCSGAEDQNRLEEEAGPVQDPGHIRRRTQDRNHLAEAALVGRDSLVEGSLSEGVRDRPWAGDQSRRLPGTASAPLVPRSFHVPWAPRAASIFACSSSGSRLAVLRLSLTFSAGRGKRERDC